MKDRISGTIVVITDVPPRHLRARVLWHVSARPGPAGYLEARAWHADPITREYHESPVAVLACSMDGARRLMPAGLEPAETDGTAGDGVWFAVPRAGARRAA
jgi:hypothetical protein